MRFEPTDEQASISEVVRSIVEPWEPKQAGETEYAAATINGTLSEGSWTGIGIPEKFGGSGYGLLEAMLVIEELGAVLLPSALRSNVSARRALLAGAVHPATQNARSRCCDILTQLGGGGNGAVGFMRPARATMIADAPECELVVLFADDVAFVGEPTDFGLAEARVLDLTRCHARVALDMTSLLPILDQGSAARGLAEARALLAAELVGVARTALKLSVDYAREREAFGKPIGSFQAVGHRLADTARFVDGARVMCHCTAWHADTGSSELPHFARIALLSAQRAVIHATDAAMQVHGAFGYTWEAGIHWYQRRAHVAAHLLGDTSELRRERAHGLASAVPTGSIPKQESPDDRSSNAPFT